MAKVPTENQVKERLESSDRIERRKLESQNKQRKGFVNYGQGVIPEAVWKNLPGKKLADAGDIL